MMMFHPQRLEMTLVSSPAPCLRIPAEQSQPEEPVILGSAILATGTREGKNARHLLTCTDPAHALLRKNIFFPFLLSLRHCWLCLPTARATPRKPVWNLRLFPLWAGEKLSQALGKKLFLLLPLLLLWLSSGNFLVCLSFTTSQIIVGFH